MSTSTSLPRLRTQPPAFSLPGRLRTGSNSSAREGAAGLEVALPWWKELLDDAPAWLSSVLVHMVLVIILGLWVISTPGNSAVPLKLAFGADQSLPSDDLDEGTIDLATDELKEPLSSTVFASALPNDSPEALARVVSDTPQLNPSGGGSLTGSDLAMSLPGLGADGEGDEGSGEGRLPADKTSFFGLAGEGGKFVYVLDRSDSMNLILPRFSEGTLIGNIIPLEAAKTELKRSLSALSNTSKFQIVFYNDRVELFHAGRTTQGLYSATNANKEAAYDYIDNTPGQGSTFHKIALEAAVDFDPDVIFLLTDARAENDLPYDVVDRVIDYCKKHRIVLNVVHFSDVPRPDCTLIDMAEGTGGNHIFINLTTFAPFDNPDEPDDEF
jgi:hypothetical protein